MRQGIVKAGRLIVQDLHLVRLRKITIKQELVPIWATGSPVSWSTAVEHL
jgi:hypothetical protein